MDKSIPIRILAAGNNESGDLFTRLAKDLFFALGYDDLRFNIHKSGREIDLQGQHRFEPRFVVGECKAHAEKIGGGDLNKFFGALARERTKRAPAPVAGYFVSLGGFTETGVDQELESGDSRLVLLNAEKTVTELESCRAIVSRAEAVERAGRCAHGAGLLDGELDGVELLGHNCGYVWVVFYAHGKERKYFSLIHADGTALAKNVADEVVKTDRLCEGTLHSLTYLAPPVPAPDRKAITASAEERYRRWLDQEFGYIHLDGMPADSDLSATRLKLEQLFVPLKVRFPAKEGEVISDLNIEDRIKSVGEVIAGSPHLALLAMPGAGKSTLIKRLAMAYAFPERRQGVSDDLPQRQWLPLILRCRELRDRAHRPITELLDDIPRHAGMVSDEFAVFRDSMHTKLRSGQVLLLIDGLDEISDEGARQTFAGHLRTFLAMFPQVALVVTSREAGFRLVAGVVASACEQVVLAPLDEEDVSNLCERWHVQVVGNTEKVRKEAKELAVSIWENHRIRTLAENPLLLTTLLVVKRTLRELPRNRTTLYREAIRVLVRTWNVEGYEPLDEGETLAQLSFVACAMTEDGRQQIGHKELLALLHRARRELEAELHFSRVSPQEFVKRIEYRSSLLMQTGHQRFDAELEPVFEFRHLTFQEYLAARGYVEEQYPGRNEAKNLAEVLEPHFKDERWREVLALAAVLAGRKAEELVRGLIAASQESKELHLRPADATAAFALSLCVRDEVQLTLPTLQGALRESARLGYRDSEVGWTTAILHGKFSDVFKKVVEDAFLSGGSDIQEYGSSFAKICELSFFGDGPAVMSANTAATLAQALERGSREERISAALVSMLLAFYGGNPATPIPGRKLAAKAKFKTLVSGLSAMLESGDIPEVLSASWAFAWFGHQRVLEAPPDPALLLSLYKQWRKLEHVQQARFPAWAIGAQRLLPRDTFDRNAWGDCDSFLRTALAEETYKTTGHRSGALVVAWYRSAPLSDEELAQEIVKGPLGAGRRIDPIARQMLEGLGKPGHDALSKYKRKTTSKIERLKTKRKKS